MSEKQVEDFLARYDEPVQQLALALRERMRALVPDAQEKLHTAWKTIAYRCGSGRRGAFCAISPHTEWVNLQFHAGTALDDPKGLLEGTGRSMRHVKIRTKRDVKSAALGQLVRAAAEHGR